MSEKNGVPPDAGASYLGAYTLKNEWAVWLLKNDPHLLTMAPAKLHRTDVGTPPKCTAPREAYSERRGWHVAGVALGFDPDVCGMPMVYRPGFWCCYIHGETVRRRVFLKAPPLRLYDDDGRRIDDMLALVGKDVDVEWRDGKWRVVEVAK